MPVLETVRIRGCTLIGVSELFCKSSKKCLAHGKICVLRSRQRPNIEVIYV